MTTSTKTKTRETAASAYAARQATIMNLMEVIENGRIAHAMKFEKPSVSGIIGARQNWTSVADLAEVEKYLRMAAHHLGQDVAAGQTEDCDPIK